MNIKPTKEMHLSADEVEIILKALDLYAMFCSERMTKDQYIDTRELILKFKIEKQKHYVDFFEKYKNRFPIT